jgi:TonB family protein
MPATEIPPRSTVPATPPATLPGSDLYDAGSWETAYTEMHDVPALLIQLQDDLSRSRQREAFWISVVVHLAIVILAVNSTRFEALLHKRAVIMVSPEDLLHQKELTYLELPPDEQKLTQRPKTNNISDKDRVAQSKAPQLDRKELKKILDSARPGAPGPSSPPAQLQQPAPPTAAAQNPPAAPDQASPQAPPQQDQVARLQTPAAGAPRPSFSTGAISPGSAIEQAARAAISNRGGYSGGDNGDYGLGQGKQPGEAIGPLEVLSDTMGVDFGPYLARVLHDVRENWYRIIPESARAPLMKKGKVSIQFAILKDGQVAGLQIIGSSGDVALDRAAYGGITASKPFSPLPSQFGGPYLALRFHFFYNPDKSELQ